MFWFKQLKLNSFVGNTDSCQAALNFTAYGRFGDAREYDEAHYYKLVFRAGDYIEPGHHNEELDTVRVELYKPLSGGGYEKIYDTYSDGFGGGSSCVGSARTGLDHGNITIGL